MGRHTPPARQRQLVARWRRSDLSAAAFARAHRVRPGTFLTWIRRHPLEPAKREEPEVGECGVPFVKVAPAPVEFVVRLGRHALTFHEPPPAGWFAAVVRELGSC
jgi:hypothetical protein